MDDGHLNDNGTSRLEKEPFSPTEALPLLVVAGLVILFLLFGKAPAYDYADAQAMDQGLRISRWIVQILSLFL